MARQGLLRSRAGSHLEPQFDQEGNVIEVETREDEEQNVKLAETLELLVAAGYFRARIKGLSPFDKVVGGMVWCITTCNFDVDVDLLFQESSTIGQKIALTEKIVAVLPKMKCLHQLEPHQIQGLDFIHIYPVVQWLVKKAIETREEMGDSIRAFSEFQFGKAHSLQQDEEFSWQRDQAAECIQKVYDVYKPQRRFRRQVSAAVLTDEDSRVHSTLLEYGRRHGLSLLRSTDKKESVTGTGTARDKAAEMGDGTEHSEEDEEYTREAEELRIKALMSGMAAMATEEGRLAASTVGYIVGLQSEEIKQIATEYAEKQSELVTGEGTGRSGALQQHKRQVATLQKQLTLRTKQVEEVQVANEDLQTSYVEVKAKLEEMVTHKTELDRVMKGLDTAEKQTDAGVLQRLRDIVAMNENLKKKEQEFKAYCKEEMSRLQVHIEELKTRDEGSSTEDMERAEMTEQLYQSELEKLQKIRIILARKNRDIAVMQRRMDDVPSRAELTQYQRRFLELYNQVSATHKETKQFYTLYNTLDDKKLCLDKEVNLLNSIHDNFHQAMGSSGSREQYLKQLELIVDGIKNNKTKAEKKRQENKMRRDQLNDEYLDLLEKQRLYFKTVKEFKAECRKNEMLLSKLRAQS
uniref:coiled-coil domain-containing protein 93 isoform X2 n=1 Tax=Myxine glutinosa TaxID=7769 RepID=UPI00358FA7C7